MFKKIFFLCLFALLVYTGLQAYFFIQKGYWDGRNRFNLLFQGRPSYLVSLVPADQQVFWQPLTTLPADVFVDLSLDITNNCFYQEEHLKTCLLSQFHHRLNSWDNWRFWWYLRGLSSEKITKVAQTGSFFRDAAIIKDDFSFAVINTTGHFGLAAKIGQLITNSGGRVVRLADDTSRLSSCQIKTEPRFAHSYTVRKLLTFLRCQLFLGSVENERATVVIRLGEQNWADF